MLNKSYGLKFFYKNQKDQAFLNLIMVLENRILYESFVPLYNILNVKFDLFL